MANFPTDYQLIASQDLSFDDLTVDRAIDGTGYGRTLYDGPIKRFGLKFAMTEAQRDALLAFYLANRNVQLSFTWQDTGETFTNMMFEAMPAVKPYGGGLYDVSVTLVAKGP